jgi:2-C-methyl-D-erythritol 2,4-cyclodiphosphate synthase
LRTGIGVDAHRFQAGRRMILGGVEIEAEMGLAGHSDADVLLHAVMDALLGACSAGDVGEMFPDQDPAYEGASSLDLLQRVHAEVRLRGYTVVNVDAVVICEEPKISPYRQRMQAQIARVLEVGTEAVSVKGTTTEGMGFAGRREGVIAMASVLIE